MASGTEPKASSRVEHTNLQQIALVSLHCFESEMTNLFPGATITQYAIPLHWVDHQPCLLVEGSTNDKIEANTDEILLIAERFGFTINLSTTDEE